MKFVVWFLKRPRLYPELVRRIIMKIRRSVFSITEVDQRAEAEKWCEDNAITTEEAIFQITGIKKYQPFNECFDQIVSNAELITQECPVQMGRGANLDLLFQITEYLKATRIVETGVGFGWSSLAFLLSIQQRNGSILNSTDMPYIGRNNDKWVGCIVPKSLHPYWRIYKYADREAIPKVISQTSTIDLFHYDSDKTYNGRMWAYQKLWDALRPGGIMISDDVDDNFGFRDFCENVKQPPIIVKQSYEDGRVTFQGLLIKK